jgi:hypothetical protein
MLFQKAILFIQLIATLNLFFCVPQQNDLVIAEKSIIYSAAEQTESEVQSVLELICEAIFNTDINLPVEENSALLEKDFTGKRFNRNSYTFIIYFKLLFKKFEFVKTEIISSLINYNNHLDRTNSGYGFIFRLTPF